MGEMEDVQRFARVVEHGIFECLMRAWERRESPDEEWKWRAQADKLERKFTTDYGRHYSHFIRRTGLVPTTPTTGEGA